MFNKDEYKGKLISMQDAIGKIKSGDTVVSGHGLGGMSTEFMDSILDRYEEFENVHMMDVVQLRPSKLYDPEYMAKLDGHINYILPFGVALPRKMNSAKLSDYYPAQTSDAADKIGRRSDVAIIMVTPPNEQGYVNLGPCNFYVHEMVLNFRASGKQRLTMGEVNDQMPVVFGNNWLHISQFDYFIENSTSIPTFSRSAPSDSEKTIGQYVLELIKDRDTIQMGLGGISEAVVSGLEGKHDLGVLTEMFPVGLPELVAKGIVTNKYKPLHKGVTIATFCMGDEEMYNYIRENPACEIHPASYTNSPAFIAKHPDLVAINSSLMIDLSGQIASEGIGHTQVSGPGGQLDFIIGSYFSRGGRGINLIKSATKQKDGTLSSAIVPELPPGTPVTVPRHYAQYVVTEYGIADLRYKTRRERAEALIAISHPELRNELRVAAQRNFYPA